MEAKYSLERRHKLINSIQRLKLAFLIKLMIKMSYLAWQQQTYITAMLKVLCLVLCGPQKVGHAGNGRSEMCNFTTSIMYRNAQRKHRVDTESINMKTEE